MLQNPKQVWVSLLVILVSVIYYSTGKTIHGSTKAPCTKHKHRAPAKFIAFLPTLPSRPSTARRPTMKPPQRKKTTPCTRRHQYLKKSTTSAVSTANTIFSRSTQERTPPPPHLVTTMVTTKVTACKPTDCVLSEWSSWTQCSSSCGNTGARHRYRKIITEPTCGGICPYRLQEAQRCNQFCLNGGSVSQRGCKCAVGYYGVCCEKVNGNWSPWGQWNQCSKSCDGGVQRRMRTCTKPPPSNGGADCGGPGHEVVECNKEKCPVNGDWGKWGDWSPCSSTCGEGQKFRLRQCNNPFPSNGGNPCIGLMMMTAKCQLEKCKIPVDGGWSEWLEWSLCSKSCGEGMRARTRVCNNPLPSNGGRACSGSSQEKEKCNKRPCNNGNGGSGAEGGMGKRRTNSKRHDKQLDTRNIHHNKAHGRRLLSHVSTDIISNFDAIVQSHNEESLQRDDKTIVVGPWTSWSTCTTTCGIGQRFRSRACHDLAIPCLGIPMEVDLCNNRECPS